MIGSNQGSVHRQRQGTGLATVLQGNEAQQVGNFILKDKGMQQLRRQAARNAAKELTHPEADYWSKHHKFLSDKYDELENMGVDIISKGGVDNPYQSNDPASQLYRKEARRIENLSRLSKEMQSHHEKTTAKINEKGIDHFTPEALVELNKYYNMDPNEVLEKGILPPLLEDAKPLKNGMKFWQGLMKEFEEPLPDKNLRELVKTSLAEPDSDLQRTYASKLKMLSPEGRKRIENQTLDTNLSMVEQLAFNDAAKFQPQATPIDRDEIINGWVGDIQGSLDEFGITDETGLSKSGTVRKNINSKIENRVKDGLLSNPKVMQMDIEAGLYEEGATDKETLANAMEYYTPYSRQRLALKYKEDRNVSQYGKMTPDQKVKRVQWLEHMKSKDNTLVSNAAKYLIGMETENGLAVKDVVYEPITNVLVMSLTGQYSTDKIQKTDNLGRVLSEEIVETTPKQTIELNLNIPADREKLLGYYDQSFYEYHRKQEYSTERADGPRIPGQSAQIKNENDMGGRGSNPSPPTKKSSNVLQGFK